VLALHEGQTASTTLQISGAVRYAAMVCL
jgi:hypothetical protein